MIAWLVSSAWAGAWTRDVGQVYAKAGADWYDAFAFVAPGQSQEEAAGKYFGQQYGVYAETGVVPSGWKAHVSVGLPLVVGSHTTVVRDVVGETNVRATTTRLGDLRAAAQVALHPKAPVALNVEVKLPMYRNGTVGDEYENFAEIFPKPGDGQVDVTPMVFAGAAPWSGTFGELGLGWRFRTEAFVGWDTDLEFSDGLVFNGKVGHDFGRVIGVVGTDGTVSPSATDVTRQYVAVGGSALIDVVKDHFAVEPRLGTEVWALNASRGLSLGLGMSWRQ